MFDPAKTLLTGGSGLLGGELRRLLPELIAPPEDLFDVRDPAGMEAHAAGLDLDCVFHAAAFTSPPKIDENPLKAIETNIIGTANVVQFCARQGCKLVYVSTDYVFKGDRGLYTEEDPVLPVNKYAWSKLGGECAVRLYEPSLIIRTTFGPNEFPYPNAFVDQWTSRERVSVIAAMMVEALRAEIVGVLHIGGPRKTVYEFAKSLHPEREIGAISRSSAGFAVPEDTSLDTGRYRKLIEKG